MAGVYLNIFQQVQPSKKLLYNQEGSHAYEVDVREDEEQSVKLQEIIELLVAAGYFRARIKGLSPFDKVVGGMTWCIESCNVDVDVDVLFQENSTIGQKITLTEKIVATLPTMKCPHFIEPHQIQGLDFIHIFPVIQWLVKRSVEYRQEKSEFVRSYAIEKYNQEFGLNTEQSKSHGTILKNIKAVEEKYSPRRCYKRKNIRLPVANIHVQLTLLEYGYKSGDLQNALHTETGGSENILDLQRNHQDSIIQEEDLDEEDLKSLAKHYTSLQLEFKDDVSKIRGEKQIMGLKEHIRLFSERYTKLDSEKSSLEELLEKGSAKLREVRLRQEETDNRIEELDKEETMRSGTVKEIEELVILNENLKLQETQFKDYCKKELTRLQDLIKATNTLKSPAEDGMKTSTLSRELVESVKYIRLQLAKKNRTVSALQRHIDAVPNRPELAQYQRRFLELYNQVSAKHRETKQYYTLYNTLEDTKLYMKKELSLLNSISDSYPEAIQSNSNKEDFQKQFQNIVDGVKQSREKVERKLAEEKKKRDQMSSTLHNLVELQRKYVAAVRHLSIECKKHEMLLFKHNF